jgi:hypothetical protein
MSGNIFRINIYLEPVQNSAMSDGAVFEEPMGAIVPGNGGVSIFCELLKKFQEGLFSKKKL